MWIGFMPSIKFQILCFIEERIPEILTRAIAEEIMKVYKDEIKKTQLASMDNILYSLDIYVCKPQKKESLL